MRWQWVTLGALMALFLGIGLTATIPVGVTAQDVQDEVQTIQSSDPAMSLDAAVEGATQYLQQEQARRLRFLFAAYLVIWGVLGGYMLTLARRQARLEKELERLRSQLN